MHSFLGHGSFCLRGSGPEMFMGFNFPWLWLGLVNHWAYQRLIHDPTVTPKFPCLDDYGNSNVLKKWIKLSWISLFPRLGLLLRLDRVPRPSWKNKFRLDWGEKILNFKNSLGGKVFEFCRPKCSRRLSFSRPSWSSYALILVVEVRPRVSLGVVVLSTIMCQS